MAAPRRWLPSTAPLRARLCFGPVTLQATFSRTRTCRLSADSCSEHTIYVNGRPWQPCEERGQPGQPPMLASRRVLETKELDEPESDGNPHFRLAHWGRPASRFVSMIWVRQLQFFTGNYRVLGFFGPGGSPSPRFLWLHVTRPKRRTLARGRVARGSASLDPGPLFTPAWDSYRFWRVTTVYPCLVCAFADGCAT